jgi:hypothetical protein
LEKLANKQDFKNDQIHDQSLEMDPYEFRNEQINNLITDEDAEYKRAIL